MNPLTQVKNTQKINAREAAAGISEQGSWHEKYKDSAYINVGLLPFDLNEGDLLAIFAQYGEVVDVNLVRDKATGKSRGFAFLAYEDQRSTVLAVDNLNGAKVIGRTIRVDHVANYKKKKEEDEEEEQRKREERGVCYAFQRGECNRGAACKYSHDEQRNANSGWGRKEDVATWGSKDGRPVQQSNGRDGSKHFGPQRSGNGLQDSKRVFERPNNVSQDDVPPSKRKSDGRGYDHPPMSRGSGMRSVKPSNRHDYNHGDDESPPRRHDGPSKGRDSSPRHPSDSKNDESSPRNHSKNDSEVWRRGRSSNHDSPPQSHKRHLKDNVLPRKRGSDESLVDRYALNEDSSPPRRHESRLKGGDSSAGHHYDSKNNDSSPLNHLRNDSEQRKQGRSSKYDSPPPSHKRHAKWW